MMPALLMHQYMTDYDLGTIGFPAQEYKKTYGCSYGTYG